MVDETISFEERVRRLQERQEAKKNAAPPQVQQPPPKNPEPQWDNNVQLPDLGLNISEADKELDQFVDNIDIIDAYNRWCRKMRPEVGGKREGIKISCPNPAHPDKDPSAWINLDKQTYYCAGCDEGGDAHDIAALNLGYPVPGYKDGETFHKLRQEMAESFGFRTKVVAGNQKVSWVEAPPEPPQPPAAPQPPNLSVVPTEVEPEPESEPNNVSPMWADDDDGEELVVYPTINWRGIIPQETFLYEYLEACSNDDAPEEYHFWHGLMALGLVVGRNVTLDDTQPVYGNLLLCILGATGTGKSRSRRHLNQVLKDSSPYKEDGTRTTGVKIVPVPGSGEHLVSQFYYEGKDPSGGNRSLGPQRVAGIVDFDEMSALLARANRQGSTLKSTLMQFADSVPDVRIGSMTRGDFIAHEPFCSITASTQPKAIRTLLNRADTSSGFLNRWIFAGGKTKQIEVIGGSRSAIRVDLSNAVELLKKVRGWGAMERTIEMEDDAYELYAKFFRDRIEPVKTSDDTDLLKRIDLITKKLMLLLTINERKLKVPKHVVEIMIELFDYVLECYGILNSNIGVTLMQDVMTEIQRHIIRHQQKTGRGATARDIARYTKRKNYTLEQIKKALDVMNSLDIIDLEKTQNGPGRPAMRYKVVGE